jgi:hypothetical protein
VSDRLQSPNAQRKAKKTGAGLLIGVGVGMMIGAAMKNLGVGIAIGIGFGMALGAAMSREK